MIFEWSLTLGNILTVVGFCLSGIAFVLFMRSDIMVLANRVSNIEGAMRELMQANLAMAEQHGRLNSIDERLTSLAQRVDNCMATHR